MASLSPSSIIVFQMASISPFPISQDKYHFMRVQIYGHSSVQSSSTFRSRKADQPIYILGLKKIEQGQLLYPKIFPLISQRITLDPQVCSHPISSLELQIFQESHSQEQNGQMHSEKSSFLLLVKIKFQPLYFIKTRNWFIKKSKIRNYFEKRKKSIFLNTWKIF